MTHKDYSPHPFSIALFAFIAGCTFGGFLWFLTQAIAGVVGEMVG